MTLTRTLSLLRSISLALLSCSILFSQTTSTKELRMLELPANGQNFISLSANPSVASNFRFEFSGTPPGGIGCFNIGPPTGTSPVIYPVTYGACSGVGVVTSVTTPGNGLVISPTTGAVVVSLPTTASVTLTNLTVTGTCTGCGGGGGPGTLPITNTITYLGSPIPTGIVNGGGLPVIDIGVNSTFFGTPAVGFAGGYLEVNSIGGQPLFAFKGTAASGGGLQTFFTIDEHGSFSTRYGILSGTGQITTSAVLGGFSTTGNPGSTIYLEDLGTSTGNGGAVAIGSDNGLFAVIKGQQTSTSGPVGDISFQLRLNSTDTTFSEVGRFSSATKTFSSTNADFTLMGATGRFTKVQELLFADRAGADPAIWKIDAISGVGNSSMCIADQSGNCVLQMDRIFTGVTEKITTMDSDFNPKVTNTYSLGTSAGAGLRWNAKLHNVDIDGTVTGTGIDCTAGTGGPPGTNECFTANGNAFGFDAPLGTVDNFALQFKTNNLLRGEIRNNGAWHIGGTGTAVPPGFEFEVSGGEIMDNGFLAIDRATRTTGSTAIQWRVGGANNVLGAWSSGPEPSGSSGTYAGQSQYEVAHAGNDQLVLHENGDFLLFDQTASLKLQFLSSPSTLAIQGMYGGAGLNSSTSIQSGATGQGKIYYDGTHWRVWEGLTGPSLLLNGGYPVLPYFTATNHGAICDGFSHSLSSLGYNSSTMASAFPLVTATINRSNAALSLSDEIDWAATMQAIGEAAQSLTGLSATSSGGIVQLPRGVCMFNKVIDIGNGTSTTNSTYNSITFQGMGMGKTRPGEEDAGTVLVWDGLVNSALPFISVNGPVAGIFIKDMLIDPLDSVGYGIQTLHAFNGGGERVTIHHPLVYGLDVTAYPAFASGPGANNNLWRQINVKMIDTCAAGGVRVGGNLDNGLLNVARTDFYEIDVVGDATRCPSGVGPIMMFRYADSLNVYNLYGVDTGPIVFQPPSGSGSPWASYAPSFPMQLGFYNTYLNKTPIVDTVNSPWINNGVGGVYFSNYVEDGGGPTFPQIANVRGYTSMGWHFGEESFISQGLGIQPALSVRNWNLGTNYGAALEFLSTDGTTSNTATIDPPNNIFTAGRIYGGYDGVGYANAKVCIQDPTSAVAWVDVFCSKNNTTTFYNASGSITARIDSLGNIAAAAGIGGAFYNSSAFGAPTPHTGQGNIYFDGTHWQVYEGLTGPTPMLSGGGGGTGTFSTLLVDNAAADTQVNIAHSGPRLGLSDNANWASRTVGARFVLATAPGQFGLPNKGDAFLFTENGPALGTGSGDLYLGANLLWAIRLDTTGTAHFYNDILPCCSNLNDIGLSNNPFRSIFASTSVAIWPTSSLKRAEMSATQITYVDASNNTMMQVSASGSFFAGYSSTGFQALDISGHTYPASDASWDIGSNAERFRNILASNIIGVYGTGGTCITELSTAGVIGCDASGSVKTIVRGNSSPYVWLLGTGYDSVRSSGGAIFQQPGYFGFDGQNWNTTDSIYGHPQAGSLIQIQNVGVNSLYTADAYGAGFQPGIKFRGARGTPASPALSLSGDTIGSITAHGAISTVTTGGLWSVGGNVAIGLATAENFGPSNQGTAITLQVTQNASTTRYIAFKVDNDSTTTWINAAGATNATLFGSSGNMSVRGLMGAIGYQANGFTGVSTTLNVNCSTGTGTITITGGVVTAKSGSC